MLIQIRKCWSLVLLVVFICLPFGAAQADDSVIVLTEAEAIEKAKQFYDTKGEWAGKFSITKVHKVRYEQQGAKGFVVHMQYQAGFSQDLSRTVEDQRTFGFKYQNGWQVLWMGGHKSARF